MLGMPALTNELSVSVWETFHWNREFEVSNIAVVGQQFRPRRISLTKDTTEELIGHDFS